MNPIKVQVLVSVAETPEDYCASEGHRKIRPPEVCPNCTSTRRLRLHGYYQRAVSAEQDGAVTLIRVRRFRCRDCSKTTSLLPWFAQTYRLVRTQSVGDFLRDGSIRTCDLKWLGLLNRYRARHSQWLPELLAVLPSFGGATSPDGFWPLIDSSFGGVIRASERLTSVWRITLFGRYLCHFPYGTSQSLEHDHTTLLFASGSDPPN